MSKSLRSVRSGLNRINSLRTKFGKACATPASLFGNSFDLVKDMKNRSEHWVDKTATNHCVEVAKEVAMGKASQEAYIILRTAEVKSDFEALIPFLTEAEQKAYDKMIAAIPKAVTDLLADDDAYLSVFAPELKVTVTKKEKEAIAEAVAETV